MKEELFFIEAIKEAGRSVDAKQSTWDKEVLKINAEYGMSMTADALRFRFYKLRDRDGEVTIKQGETKTVYGNGVQEQSKDMYLSDLDDTRSILTKAGYDPDAVELIYLQTQKKEIFVKQDGLKQLHNVIIKVKPLVKHNTKDYLDIVKEVFKKEIKPLKVVSKKQKELDDDNLTFLMCPELHLNKKSFDEIAEEYNIEIAKERFRRIISEVIEKQRIMKSGTLYLTIGNDFLNSDTPNNTTTAGTQMNNDVHWKMAFRIAIELLTEALLSLDKEFNKIEIAVEPANHDYASSFMLFEAIRNRFYNFDSIHFNESMKDTQTYQFGKTLIVTNHGDKNIKRFIETIPARFRELWGQCEFVYVFSGHEHHDEMRVNKNGITHHKLGTITNEDEYEDTNSFIGSIKQQQYFIFNKHCGKIAELFVVFPQTGKTK